MALARAIPTSGMRLESDNSEQSESDLGSAIESEEESDDDGWD